MARFGEVSAYVAQMWRMRYFWFSLTWNDIVSRYRHSFLGIGWSLVRPLAMTCVFCVVFATIFNQPLQEYAPFVLAGMALWQYLAESLVNGCRSFSNSAPYIRQQRIPLAVFPLRHVLSSTFHCLIALTLAIVLRICLRGALPPLAFVYLVPGIIVFFLFCWLGAIILGMLQSHFPDTSNLLEIVLQILFYVTPVMYSAKQFEGRARLSVILDLNPLYALLEMVRRPILEGQLPPLGQLGYAVGLVAVMAVLAWIFIKKLERTLVFWL